MRIHLISFLLIIVAIFNAHAQKTSIEVSGSVSGIWMTDTVRVVGDIDIEEGETLSIDPGVLVEFHGSYSFYVRGILYAVGTMDSPIMFDVADTNGFSVDSISKGGWNGIQFYYNSFPTDSSVFEHCIFTHAKAVSPDSIENHGGAMGIRYSDKVRISNCTFINNFASLNGGAIYLEASSSKINGCTFIENHCGPAVFPWGYGGAVCSDNASPVIFGNHFAYNSSTGVGGGVAIRFKDAPVNNNSFENNYSGLGGAIAYLHYYEYPFTQCNNLMFHNMAEFFGGAIACLDGGPTFVNNTLSENSATYGGAFYVKDTLIPNIYNCIFWENDATVGPEVYLWDAIASANFYFSDIQGGPDLFGGSGGGAGYTGIYENNLDHDPQFSGPLWNSYNLLSSSPCIDMGTPNTSGLQLPAVDLDGNPRLYNNIDMGCYETLFTGIGLKTIPDDSKILIYPNPAEDEVTIRSWMLDPGCWINIFDFAGGKLACFKAPLNQNEIKLDISDYTPGLYFVIIQNNEKIMGQKQFVKY